MQISNLEYVKSLEVNSHENKARLLEAMEKYGDNKWWLSTDLKEIGYFQLFEPLMIAPSMNSFRNGVNDLLETEIFTTQLSERVLSEIKLKAKDAWNNLI